MYIYYENRTRSTKESKKEKISAKSAKCWYVLKLSISTSQHLNVNESEVTVTVYVVCTRLRKID